MIIYLSLNRIQSSSSKKNNIIKKILMTLAKSIVVHNINFNSNKTAKTTIINQSNLFKTTKNYNNKLRYS